MNNKPQEEPNQSLNIGDIYFVLFKHKWLILSFILLGFVATGAILIIKPAQYESDAKLYVQYVAAVRPTPSGNGDDSIKQTDAGGAGIVLTEVEFLTSLDLAQEVVEHVGAEKILAKLQGGSDTNAAAGVILKGLLAEPATKTPSIIDVSFQHPDSDVAREVLREIIDAYINKSAEQHRTVGDSDEYLASETKRLREQLENTEQELSEAKRDADIISTLEETKKGWNDEYVQISAELLDAGTQLAVRSAGNPQAANGSTGASPAVATNVQAEIPAQVRDDYLTTCSVLVLVRAKYSEDLLKYPPGSLLLDPDRTQLKQLESRKSDLEQRYPQLANLDVPDAPGTATQSASAADGSGQLLKVNQLTAKTNYLLGKLAEIRQAQAKLETKEPHIMELEHRKSIQESALTRTMASLEQSRNDGDQNLAGGIKIPESPTPPVKKWSKSVKKLVGLSLAGGCFGGIGLAFLIELVLDNTVKRPGEIEKKLHLPLFISIPDTHPKALRPTRALIGNGQALLAESNGGGGSLALTAKGAGAKDAHADSAPWDVNHPLHRFYAGLRDRLVVNFEVRNLHHNPKLVGVTSCRKGAGVSSIAAGLAASLSEGGDGNVLLVDMRGGQGASLHFHKGKPVSGHNGALEDGIKNAATMGENPRTAPNGGEDNQFPSVLSKRFATLVPKLKASEYDYIIFDMPPVSQTSITPRLAGLMDMVLLVIESEKTHRNAVQRATALLHESRAQVSTVLNKVKSYVPARLHQEFLDDEV
jgi:uncharacterized protein involved in exopolysaccharide biosynthesis/Mrp family chromosome partitioning ATPase